MGAAQIARAERRDGNREAKPPIVSAIVAKSLKSS